MTKAVWHYVDSGKCSPSFNMALDEALLDLHSRGEIGPVLRFYEWEPATLSIGYFQRIEKDIDMEKVQELGLGFVRRPTGGRGVLHEHELTYSVIVSEQYPNMPETVTEAYRVISGGLLQGFRNLGLQAEFSIPDHDVKEQLRSPKSGVCFDAPSWYELVVEGKKVAGSAQTRQKGVILQHGAILMSLDVDKLTSIFTYSSPALKERVRRTLPDRAIAIDRLTDREISVEECKQAFSKGFEASLDISLEPLELTPEQLALVHQIEKEKYANNDWNFKK
ncbi:lipoate--protein ligase family protein [Sporosarcina sp. P3]|uniref:lipoate--protein ligase family protein n=1 Tax=Sporosarcina TaxID=1569 RepID=UPI0009DC6FA1|nr:MULTISPECIES: biotin/lipoate A/B protein ligase family protein [Sporosarcina]ARF15873.1 octanoyltransferase [Sporosarcina ureae]PID22996.1 lipoate--protein ligase family protein [Sporosarcina sp. P3]